MEQYIAPITDTLTRNACRIQMRLDEEPNTLTFLVRTKELGYEHGLVVMVSLDPHYPRPLVNVVGYSLEGPTLRVEELVALERRIDDEVSAAVAGYSTMISTW